MGCLPLSLQVLGYLPGLEPLANCLFQYSEVSVVDGCECLCDAWCVYLVSVYVVCVCVMVYVVWM